MNDSDRVAKLNFVEVWARKLATAPGGVVTMHQRMIDATAGVKGQNYDSDTRSDRYEVVEMPSLGGRQVRVTVRVPPNDPTGETAITEDEARRALRSLDRLLGSLHEFAQDLAGMHDVWCPPVGAQLPLDTDDGPGPNWCKNCWKDDRHCEPVSLRPDTGKPYYVGLCRWCGSFKAEQGFAAPIQILRMRHQGKRITLGAIQKYKPQPKRKKAS